MKLQSHNNAGEVLDGATAFRCLCGSLLARLVPEGVELKCRRCRRRIIVPLTEKDLAVEKPVLRL